VLVIAVAGGCCAPLVTGGLTGLLRDLVPGAERNCAYSLDAMSYNAPGICGPVVAGLLVTAFGPVAATLTVAACAVAGAGRHDRAGGRRPAVAAGTADRATSD
jgi:MFS family permease